MNANFCDRCGKHIPGYAADHVAECGGKYRIRMVYGTEKPCKLDRYTTNIGRGLIFCEDCQKKIDKLIDDECRKHLPKELVADAEIVKAHDDEEES